MPRRLRAVDRQVTSSFSGTHLQVDLRLLLATFLCPALVPPFYLTPPGYQAVQSAFNFRQLHPEMKTCRLFIFAKSTSRRQISALISNAQWMGLGASSFRGERFGF